MTNQNVLERPSLLLTELICGIHGPLRSGGKEAGLHFLHRRV
jgi:hypothetical protein